MYNSIKDARLEIEKEKGADTTKYKPQALKK